MKVDPRKVRKGLRRVGEEPAVEPVERMVPIGGKPRGSWECHRCHSVWGPHVAGCEKCNVPRETSTAVLGVADPPTTYHLDADGHLSEEVQ